MSAYSKDRKEERLLQLSEEVGRIAGTLARLSTEPDMGAANKASPTADIPEISVQTVSAVIRARRLREKYFSAELFSDPAWDIMLDLLHSELMQVRVSVSNLCMAAAVPATTALRWIGSMAEQGLIVRHGDPRDRRRVFIELAPEVSLALRRYFAELDRPVTI